jgi:hypothetical protein
MDGIIHDIMTFIPEFVSFLVSFRHGEEHDHSIYAIYQ